MEQKVLKDFMELFPITGQVVPFVELKFRLGAKYGQKSLDKFLKEFEDQGVLSKFEFNNTIHYKSKKDIPTEENTNGPSSPASAEEQYSALTELVVAMAEVSTSPKVKEFLRNYKETL